VKTSYGCYTAELLELFQMQDDILKTITKHSVMC